MVNKSVVVDLADVGPGGLRTVGGKALNLGRMLRAGLPVPAGFCVTTAAYDQVVGDRLSEVLTELAEHRPEAAARQGRQEPRGSTSGRARRLVLSAPVPEDLTEPIIRRYRDLGEDVPVAVRSSATAEDLPGASFAGQQDTYLNVVGADAVLDATRRCWASLWTERAVSYRDSQGIDHTAVSLAVVVQRMVDAEVAGVMFTADPVTGSRSQLVIDAGPGLGESVVSGSVNPDRFVVRSDTGDLVEQRLGDKRSAVRPSAGGGTTTVELSDATDSPCLDRADLAALVRLAARIDTVYGEPQDTEWAIDADRHVWLTQARPITTLYPLPSPDAASGPTRAWLCVSLAQGLTRPITPMGQAAFRLMASSVARVAGFPQADPYAGPPGFRIVGERLFADITPALRHARARRVATSVAGVMEARTKKVLQHLTSDPRFAPLPPSQGGRASPILARIMITTKIPLRLLAGLVSPTRAHRAVDRFDRRVRERWRLPTEASPADRLDAVEQRLGTDTFLIMPTVFPYAAAGLLAEAAARRLAPADLRPTLFADLRRGLPDNVTTEMDLELWGLAVTLGRDQRSRELLTIVEAQRLAAAYAAGELPHPFQHGLASFLARYGHRAVAEIDLGMPRWSDDPAHLLSVLGNYLRLDDPALAPDRQFARGADIAAAAVTAITEATRRDGRTGPLRAPLVAFALGRARALVGLRERPKSILVYALAVARHELGRVGAAAVARGALDDEGDTWFLDLRQLRRGLDGVDQREAVRDRRTVYDLELRRRHIPRVLLSDGTEPETMIPTDTPAGALLGSPASVGTTTGPARVILDPTGAHLEPGEILVAPSTDPGWTPLFLTAGGLVMEMGGSMSHGAVVAREYGIPAVVGVPDATRTIITGQLITVDGAAGTVVIP